MTSSNLVGCCDRQIGRLGALENSAGVDAALAIRIRKVGAVAHQAAGYRRIRATGRSPEPHGAPPAPPSVAIADEERIGADDERVGPALHQGREGWLDVALAASFQDMSCTPERPRRSLRSLVCGLEPSGLVDRRDRRSWSLGDQLAQELEPLGRKLRGDEGDTRDVAARPVEAGDEAELDRIGAEREDDGYRRGRRLGRERRPGAAAGNNHRYLAANQIGRQRRQPIRFVVGPAVFDRDVLALDDSRFP